eukprot:gene27507-2509_t
MSRMLTNSDRSAVSGLQEIPGLQEIYQLMKMLEMLETSICSVELSIAAFETSISFQGAQWSDRDRLENPKSAFNEAFLKSQLSKWDMTKGLQMNTFRYTKYYHKIQREILLMDLLNDHGAKPMQAEVLLMDLLNDPGAKPVLKVLTKGSEWVPLAGTTTKVEVENVPCTLTRLDLFDKISTSPEVAIVRSTGDIVKCMDDVREGFQISDMLREMLLSDESENADLYSDEEKAELLWKVFEALCLGGPCCQFEDRLEPYIEVTKKVYKELLAVQKNSAGKVEVASSSWLLRSLETDAGDKLFPAHSRNSFCFVTIDPLRRLVHLSASAAPAWPWRLNQMPPPSRSPALSLLVQLASA